MKGERVLRISLFLILADLLSGGIAAALNRTLVEMPAWHHLGAGAWAAFSQMADLGNGEILYPLVGIGGTVSILAAAIAFRFNSRRPWSCFWSTRVLRRDMGAGSTSFHAGWAPGARTPRNPLIREAVNSTCFD